MLNRAEAALVIAMMILALSGCGSAPQLASRWRTDAVEIDGRATEWEHVPVYAGNQKFTVSAQHDSEYLYLCLTTKDRDMQMQLRFSGLIVWFDRDGGKKKDFGINYPLGLRGGEPPSVEDRGKRDPGTEDQPMIDPPDRGISSIDILGPGEGDRFRLSTVENSGVQVKMGRSERELLVYELQVPLKKSHDHPYAIEARAGVAVGIGIVSATTEKDMRGPERLDPPEGGEGGMGGPPPGGMGGGMGAPGGRGGGRGGRGARGGPAGRPEPLDFWMKLTLNEEEK